MLVDWVESKGNKSAEWETDCLKKKKLTKAQPKHSNRRS